MKVVTIARAYAAGGHSVGHLVADKLGIELYDRDIILKAAQASGVEFSQIYKEEEVISRGQAFARAISPSSFDLKDTIYSYEAAAIVDLAKKGPCVIIGRCAAPILQDEHIDIVSVFLHAAPEKRLPRVKQLLELDSDDAAFKAMKRIDIARRSYYELYTGRKWGLLENYTLTLDTGALDKETCADIICQVARG